MLIPKARWTKAMATGGEIRVFESFFASHDEDHLVNVAISAKTSSASGPFRQALIQIRQEDRWEDVRLVFNPANGFVRIQVGKRKGEIRVWDPSSKPSNDAIVLELLTTADPPAWSVAQFSGKKKRNMQRAFQRFTERPNDWVPIVDGEPFCFDPGPGRHTPHFQLARKS